MDGLETLRDWRSREVKPSFPGTTEKLVRLQIADEFYANPLFRLPPGYEEIWLRKASYYVELLIKGEFPESFPDCAPVDCQLSVEHDICTGRDDIYWHWLFYPKANPQNYDPKPIKFYCVLPSFNQVIP